MKKKGVIIIGVVVGLAVAAAIAVVAIFVLGALDKQQVPDPGEGQHGAMIALTDQVVNLTSAADGTGYRYCKIGVTVEVRPTAPDFYKLEGEARITAEKEVVKAYESVLPLLADQVGKAVAAMDSATLGTPAGRAELQQTLQEGFQEVLGKTEAITNPSGKVADGVSRFLNLYFTTLVMQ